MNEPGDQICGAESHHFPIGIDSRTNPGGIGAREYAGVSEPDQGDGAASNQNWDDRHLDYFA